MNLLVIEDDHLCCEMLRRGLSLEGYRVDTSSDGTAGLQQALQSDYALIVLDVMLPGQSGWSILTELRKCNKSVPILILTGRGSVPDRVKGLNLGADGYLPKPFAWEEFRARVRSLLRRRQAVDPSVIRIADLEIDLTLMKAVRGGRRLDLTVTEFRLLSVLASRHGELLTRDYLLEKVWGISALNTTNVIGVAISRLRSKVDAPFPVRIIHVVHGKGYMLDMTHGGKRSAVRSAVSPQGAFL